MNPAHWGFALQIVLAVTELCRLLGVVTTLAPSLRTCLGSEKRHLTGVTRQVHVQSEMCSVSDRCLQGRNRALFLPYPFTLPRVATFLVMTVTR